jgi:hypothetical protein
VPREQANCLAFAGTRKSGVCFCSNRNDEEREARIVSDGEQLLVEEIPALGTK